MILPMKLMMLLSFAGLAWPLKAAAPTDPRDKEAAAAASDNEIVCKYQAKTGSRFKKKDCRTRLQWDQLSVQHQRDAKEMIDRPHICGGGGNPEGC